MSLFRSEVITQRTDRLSGDVALAVPVAWQAIGFLIFGGLAVAFTFLALASYSRVETVGGALTPDSGVVTILPSRSGIVVGITTSEGALVPAGATLASIRAEEDIAQGRSSGAIVEAAIAQQDLSLSAQSAASNAAAMAQQGQIIAQRSGLASEITQLNSQISLQRELVSSAQKDLDRAKTVAGRGFLSGRDLQVREEALLARKQQLSQLEQTLASRRAAIAEAERNAAQLLAQARAQSANIAATRAQVAQQAASTQGSRAYVLRAPVAGRVTALTARVGQTASPQSPMMTIVPANSKLRAELAVPTSAIGFLRPGQEVRLAVDAFPYQRFGTIKGRILTVSGSPISRQSSQGSVISVYPVMVELTQTSILAFGRQQALVSGMTLSARIVTEKQSLLEWLFEPLFAVRRR